MSITVYILKILKFKLPALKCYHHIAYVALLTWLELALIHVDFSILLVLNLVQT